MGSDPYEAYIGEKLRGAVDAIRSDDDRLMRDRLLSAYRYNLSSLDVERFPDEDERQAFADILAKFTRYGEGMDGAGSVPTTLGTMSEADARALADRILAWADRYLA